MSTIRKTRHRKPKSKSESKPKKGKDNILFAKLLDIKVSKAVEVMDELKIREYAKQYPENTFGDLFGVVMECMVKAIKENPETWGVTKEQVEKVES